MFKLLIFVFFFYKTGFHHVGQAGLELPTSGDPPDLASKVLGLQAWATTPSPQNGFFQKSHMLQPYAVRKRLTWDPKTQQIQTEKVEK